MKKSLTILSTLLLAALLGLAGYSWLALNWSYSTGERAGLLQKFSKKGWLCKTWEGELLLSSMPGAIPEKFEFTVRDESIVDALNANAGRKVILGYEQHKGLPSSCFGDSEYFVNKVSVFTEAKP
jgi:hypothetical protein